MMQVTGEEGVTLDDYVRYQKSLFVDMVYLQQDGFDSVDAAVPLERQKQMFGLIQRVLDRDYHFRDKEQVRAVVRPTHGAVQEPELRPARFQRLSRVEETD